MGASLSSETNLKAVTVFKTGPVYGTVLFEEGYGQVIVTIRLSKLKPGKHGLHIHEYGDLREGCKSACNHYNPGMFSHGGLDDLFSHAGDLGNIIVDRNGNCAMQLTTNKFKIRDILGRSLIIHANEDDLGLTGHKDSKTTGNSGERIACEIIGLAA